MPGTLYLRPSPRAYFLLTDTHALIFRQPDAGESKASRSVVVAEFLPLEEVDTSGLVRASGGVGRGRGVEGVLGVTSVPSDRSPIPEIFLLVISSASLLSPLLPGSSLRPSRVLGVEFHSLTSSFWDSAELLAGSATPTRTHTQWDEDDPDPYAATSSSWASSSGYHTPTQSQASAQGVEHPCLGMRKYLESGGFFFAQGAKWDISTRMGEVNWVKQASGEEDLDGDYSGLETFDERFVWNHTLLAPLLAFRKGLSVEDRAALDRQELLVPVIQGFVGSSPIAPGPSANTGQSMGSIALISRLSWKRAGARFRTRGIDDDGQVANFVETEVILSLPGGKVVYTWSIVRGSVPLFWQQPSQGLGTLQQKVEITRPPQASQSAFDKHFMELIEQYHAVHAVNLLGQKDAESMLSLAYSDHLKNLKRALEEQGQGNEIDLTPYDFHTVVRLQGHEAVRFDMGTRLREVVRSRHEYGWNAIDAESGELIQRQEGVFRVNCLDCLDRTNYVQDVLSSLALGEFLQSVDSPLLNNQTFWTAHRSLWADNGDRLSKTYAGTGALNTSATRSGKKTFAGLLSDATKSVGRAYINNFQDKGKQNAIDMLLGMMAGQRPVVLFDPISDSVHAALTKRVDEYSRVKRVNVWVGTWNLNGTPPGEELGDWLFPFGKADADIYMVAFQEIVQLTAGQILQTDPAKRRMWEKYLVDAFTAKAAGEYILYRSEQLVGTALVVIVKSSLTHAIRHVESATKKTGLQGLSGNKGGVGIRFSLYDSTVCLMTCHLAAGHSNVAERNADYKTVKDGLKFLRGKMIEDHDIIIWAADFNYRIAMPNENVRALADKGDIDQLLVADQLLQAIDDGEVFQGYHEGPIQFLPTYKYDNGTSTYDSSEKARIPAWTDRILARGAVDLKAYKRAELYSSDHRPVYALYVAEIREVDQGKKESIRREVTGHVGGLDLDEQGVKDVLGEKRELGKKLETRAKPPPPRRPAGDKLEPQDGIVNGRSPAIPPPRRSSAKVDTTPAMASTRAPSLPRRPVVETAPESLLDDDGPMGDVTAMESSLPSVALANGKPPLPARKPTLPTQTSRPALPSRPIPLPTDSPQPSSVLGAIAALEAASKQASTRPSTIKRKPPPSDVDAHSRVSTGETLSPSTTGGFVIVPRPDQKSRPAVPPKPHGTSPVKDTVVKKAPPVAVKPGNLRSTSYSGT